jgi:hypothetical protein
MLPIAAQTSTRSLRSGRRRAAARSIEREPDIAYPRHIRTGRTQAVYGRAGAMNENFSLIVMCLFLLGSLAFLAQQLTSYH